MTNKKKIFWVIEDLNIFNFPSGLIASLAKYSILGWNSFY